MGSTTPTIDFTKYEAAPKIDFTQYESSHAPGAPTPGANEFQQHLDDLIELKKLGYSGPSYVDQMIHAAGSEVLGAGKSLAQVPASLSWAINKIPGIGERLAPKAGVEQFQKAVEPQGPAEKVGAGVETAAEMAAGEGLVKNALLKIPGLAKFAPLVRIVAPSASGGGTAVLHGESPTLPTIAGAAGGVASEVLPAASTALRKSAQGSYEAILSPTKEATKYETQKIMPQLMKERPLAFSRQGLADKAASKAEEAGLAIEQKVSTMKGSMNAQPVIDGLNKLKSSFQVNGVSLRPEVDNVIDDAVARFEAMSKPGQGPGWWSAKTLDYQDAIKARRILDEAVSEAKGYQGATISDASLTNIRRTAANSIRNELSKAEPDLAQLNQKFHFWNTLSDVLEQTIKRKVGQAPSLASRLEPIAGAAMAGPEGAGALYFLGKATRSTAWRTTSAATKSALANALASQNFSEATDLLKKAGFATTLELQTAE